MGWEENQSPRSPSSLATHAVPYCSHYTHPPPFYPSRTMLCNLKGLRSLNMAAEALEKVLANIQVSGSHPWLHTRIPWELLKPISAWSHPEVFITVSGDDPGIGIFFPSSQVIF